MADLQLVLFRRQYRQLFEPDFISWPPLALLRNDDVQAWLFRHLFDSSRNYFLPPDQYQLQVLDTLVQRIKKASGNVSDTKRGDDETIYTPLASHLDQLKRKLEANTTPASQVEAFITFTCILEDYPSSPYTAFDNHGSTQDKDQTVTLLERRNLVRGSQVTGFRTWEGCMHLATYLLTSKAQQRHGIRGNRVLELGAGTGFLSILCAKHLGAKHVLSTDGDEHVVESLRENLALNRVGGVAHAIHGEPRIDVDGEFVTARALQWGKKVDGTWLQEACREQPFDVVVGADITYDKDAVVLLAFTLNELIRLQPHVEVIIAGVIRRADSFELFLSECERFSFSIDEIDCRAKPMREQKALFYAAAVPFKILSIRGPAYHT